MFLLTPSRSSSRAPTSKKSLTSRSGCGRGPTSCCWPAARENRSWTPPRTCWPVTPGSRLISRSCRRRARSSARWEPPGGKRLWGYYCFMMLEISRVIAVQNYSWFLRIWRKDDAFGLLGGNEVMFECRQSHVIEGQEMGNSGNKHLFKLQFCCSVFFLMRT